MIGYAHAVHQTLRIESGTGFRLIASLNLEPGAHIVWAKLSCGVNAGSAYPPPPYPFTSAAAALAYHDAEDLAFVGVRPQGGENSANLNLMLAAKAPRARRARLYVMNLYPLPLFVHHVWLTAVKVEELSLTQTGTDQVQDAPAEEEDRIRDIALKARIQDKGFRLADFLRKEG